MRDNREDEAPSSRQVEPDERTGSPIPVLLTACNLLAVYEQFETVFAGVAPVRARGDTAGAEPEPGRGLISIPGSDRRNM